MFTQLPLISSTNYHFCKKYWTNETRFVTDVPSDRELHHDRKPGPIRVGAILVRGVSRDAHIHSCFATASVDCRM